MNVDVTLKLRVVAAAERAVWKIRQQVQADAIVAHRGEMSDEHALAALRAIADAMLGDKDRQAVRWFSGLDTVAKAEIVGAALLAIASRQKMNGGSLDAEDFGRPPDVAAVACQPAKATR